jgi:ABC-type transport system involved in multi-copper enzyme maturation permease subunit
MTSVVTLVLHSLRRSRIFLFAACVLLFSFQWLMILVARSLEKANRFEQLGGIMPAFVSEWTNMVAASFRGFVLFGYSHPVVLIFLVALAISAGSEPAGVIESKFIDLLMSRPVRRSSVVAATMLVLVVTIAGAVGCMVLGTWCGLRLLAPPAVIVPEMRVILSLAANLGIEVLAWGAIALVVASFAKRRVTVTSTCGLLALGMFVLDYIGRFWEPAKGISRISPFHYFSPFEMIGGQTLRIRDVGILFVIVAAGAAIATVEYVRRDL